MLCDFFPSHSIGKLLLFFPERERERREREERGRKKKREREMKNTSDIGWSYLQGFEVNIHGESDQEKYSSDFPTIESILSIKCSSTYQY